MGKKIYSAADPQDAQIIKDQLEAAGFKVDLRGTALWGARGELPFTSDSAPSLWVDDGQVEAALKFVRDLEANAAKVFPVWDCSSCGETIEGNFSICWSCMTPQSGG